GSDVVGLAPGAGGVDDGAGEQFLAVGQAQDEGGQFPAGGTQAVDAQTADGGDLGAVADVGGQRGQFGQRLEVLLDEVCAGGQGGGVGLVPSGGREQAAGGGVGVELPGTEQLDVRPGSNGCGRGVAGFHDDEGDAAFGQVRCGSQAHGAGSDHGDRKAVGAEVNHGAVSFHEGRGGSQAFRAGSGEDVPRPSPPSASVRCAVRCSARRRNSAIAAQQGLA